MSSKASRRGKKHKSGSGSASEAGSVKELIELEDSALQLPVDPKEQPEPTSAESQADQDKQRNKETASPPPRVQMDYARNMKSPERNSVYGDVVRDDPIPVQVAILEPEIPVAQVVPLEPLPTQPQPGTEPSWFASTFSCCVLRK
jgi:hypothetical protein